MGVAHERRFGGIALGKDDMANNPETGRFPRIQEQICAVPGVKAHHQAVVFQHAVHFMAGRQAGRQAGAPGSGLCDPYNRRDTVGRSECGVKVAQFVVLSTVPTVEVKPGVPSPVAY